MDSKVEWIDIFPTDVSHTVPKLNHTGEKSDLTLFIANNQVVAFLQCMQSDRICYALSSSVNHARAMKHFLDVAQGALQIIGSNFSGVVWADIAAKVGKHLPKKKSTTQNLAFKIQRNQFLTKKVFTFGQRKVSEETIHFYQTSQVPLLIYVLRNPNSRRAQKGNQIFKPGDQEYYNRFVLLPHRNFEIPSGTIYVLVSVHKAMFSVHVVPKNWKSPYPLSNPFEFTRLRKEEDGSLTADAVNEIYEPPPTPAQPSRAKSAAASTSTQSNGFFKRPQDPMGSDKKSSIQSPRPPSPVMQQWTDSPSTSAEIPSNVNERELSSFMNGANTIYLDCINQMTRSYNQFLNKLNKEYTQCLNQAIARCRKSSPIPRDLGELVSLYVPQPSPPQNAHSQQQNQNVSHSQQQNEDISHHVPVYDTFFCPPALQDSPSQQQLTPQEQQSSLTVQDSPSQQQLTPQEQQSSLTQSSLTDSVKFLEVLCSTYHPDEQALIEHLQKH